MSFAYYKQLNAMDCGPTCLRMIAKHYGKYFNADTLCEKMGCGKTGVSLLSISETAEMIGFLTRGVRIKYDLLLDAPLPAILHWNQSHFVVLVSLNIKEAKVADPGSGIVSFPRKDFVQHWQSSEKENIDVGGIALLMEPTPGFYQSKGKSEENLNQV